MPHHARLAAFAALVSLGLAACDAAPTAAPQGAPQPVAAPAQAVTGSVASRIVGLTNVTDGWLADLTATAALADEALELLGHEDRGTGTLGLTPGQLQRGLAHALELLQRPVQPYYLPPGEAGRMKQNYHVFTMGRLDGSWPSAPQSDTDYLVAQLMKHLDRSPEAIGDLYDAVRPILPLALGRSAYNSGPVSLYVDTLLKTYGEIVATEGWEGVFADITVALEVPRDDQLYCTPLQCGAFIKKLADPATLESLHSPCEADAGDDYPEYCGYRNAYWFYAFWYRRHAEGNMEVVHRILADVHKMYGGILAAAEPR